MERNSLAVLIDADNISYELVGEIFNRLSVFGDAIVRRAYGMVNCFSNPNGWQKASREFGITAKPQVSNVSGKNVADIALVIDAMELLYRNSCSGICIVSQDSDFTALAAKIREAGKLVYGVGNAKTPESFRAACTEFVLLKHSGKSLNAASSEVRPKNAHICPRCGEPLSETRTKSNRACRHCKKCDGMFIRLDALKSIVSEESLRLVREQAAAHSNAGCICPNCGGSMTLLRVANGTKSVEIDVCSKCDAIWYDKDEFEQLVPNDGVLVATVSAGKSYRRELVTSLSADFRGRRINVTSLEALTGLLRSVYHTPKPDIAPVISTLVCQKIIKIDKSGKLSILE